MRDRNKVVLPFNFGKNISEKDPVRKLIEICEELDYTEVFEIYTAQGEAWAVFLGILRII